MRISVLVGVALVLTACGPEDAPRDQVAQVVDSALGWDERLARFRDGLDPVTALSGGRESREALVEAWVDAVETADTGRIRDLTITREEFAYLYYPTTPQAHPPYDLAPDLMWFTLHGRSEQGITRVFERFGGRPLRYQGHDCPDTPSLEDRNTVWGPCTVTVDPDDTGQGVEDRLFSLILERDGRYKFLSLSNKLD